MGHHGLDQPVAGEDDVGLGGGGLGELEEEAGGLGEALRREEDDILELGGEGADGAALVELFWRGQRIGHVRHGGVAVLMRELNWRWCC